MVQLLLEDRAHRPSLLVEHQRPAPKAPTEESLAQTKQQEERASEQQGNQSFAQWLASQKRLMNSFEKETYMSMGEPLSMLASTEEASSKTAKQWGAYMDRSANKSLASPQKLGLALSISELDDQQSASKSSSSADPDEDQRSFHYQHAMFSAFDCHDHASDVVCMLCEEKVAVSGESFQIIACLPYRNPRNRQAKQSSFTTSILDLQSVDLRSFEKQEAQLQKRRSHMYSRQPVCTIFPDIAWHDPALLLRGQLPSQLSGQKNPGKRVTNNLAASRHKRLEESQVDTRAEPSKALRTMVSLGSLVSFWGKAGSLDRSLMEGKVVPSELSKKNHGTASSQLSLHKLDRENVKELAQLDLEELSLQELSHRELTAERACGSLRLARELSQQELGARELGIRELSQEEAKSSFHELSLNACTSRASSFLIVTCLLVIVSFLVNSFANFKKNTWQLSGMVSFLQVSFEIFSFQDRASTSTSSRTSFQLRCTLFIMIVALAGYTPSLAGEGFQQSASPCGSFRQGELWATDLSRQLCPQQLPRAHLGHRQLPQHYLREEACDLKPAIVLAQLGCRRGIEELVNQTEDKHFKLLPEEEEVETNRDTLQKMPSRTWCAHST